MLLFAPSVAARCAAVLLLVSGCGKVVPLGADAMVDAMPDAWQSSCAVPVPLVTAVESANPGYGNSCLHGGWNLQALNGTTVPPSVEQPGHTALVHPTAIAPMFNTVDTTSTFAIHVSGSGQENMNGVFSYAQLAAPLNTLSATEVGTVDASAYTGVEFSAIINTGTGARMRIANLYTDPSGGMCAAASGPTGCYDHPGARLAQSTTWMKYQVPFASLTQVGFGNPSPTGAAFPSNAIINIRWDVDIPTTGPAPAWELWIDSVTFY